MSFLEGLAAGAALGAVCGVVAHIAVPDHRGRSLALTLALVVLILLSRWIPR